jgi:hypothetical protein
MYWISCKQIANLGLRGHLKDYVLKVSNPIEGNLIMSYGF